MESSENSLGVFNLYFLFKWIFRICNSYCFLLLLPQTSKFSDAQDSTFMNSVENNWVEITECCLKVVYFPFNLLLSECFMNYFTYKDKLRVLGLFGLEKVLGRPQSTFQYLKKIYKKSGEWLFTRSCCDRTSDEGFEPKRG